MIVRSVDAQRTGKRTLQSMADDHDSLEWLLNGWRLQARRAFRLTGETLWRPGSPLFERVGLGSVALPESFALVSKNLQSAQCSANHLHTRSDFWARFCVCVKKDTANQRFFWPFICSDISAELRCVLLISYYSVCNTGPSYILVDQ